jgi:hypothetical protein
VYRKEILTYHSYYVEHSFLPLNIRDIIIIIIIITTIIIIIIVVIVGVIVIIIVVFVVVAQGYGLVDRSFKSRQRLGIFLSF